ncbi:MAG: T9SS type A sorting domain-containing protein [Bacteroidota bacterium]
MKKIIILLLVFTPLLKVKAQITPWISQGATWHYTWWDPSMVGNDKIEYIHDTLLFGKTCEILKTTRYFYGRLGPGSPLTLLYTQTNNNYTYSNGDTVFYLNNNKFDILYNFGASLNNNWDLGVDTNYAYCSKSIVRVDSTSTQTINSNVHRVLYTSDSANSSMGITGKIIEHIGSMEYLFPTGRNCDSQTVVDFFDFSFSCFQDSTTTYLVVPQAECENPYHVGISELTNFSNTIQFFPNPIEDNLNIIFFNETQYLISIFNLLGEKVFETKNQNNQSVVVNFSSLNPGMYIATFENSSEKKINKRIIKK